jgi:hypothetical protein
VRRALFILLLFDEIAAIDRSRLGNGQYFKKQKGQCGCLIQVKDFAVASSFVYEAR